MLDKLLTEKREAEKRLTEATQSYYEQYKQERLDNNITDTLAHLKTQIWYEELRKAQTEAEIIDYRIKANIEGKS
ncbi:hypothetical protein M0R04_12175 [Candidatus Dojkabacteria bacterium]|jgi:hypothetical protein|nr:hypothetical protein [Candidatus Dojkabacteria bacterium]